MKLSWKNALGAVVAYFIIMLMCSWWMAANIRALANKGWVFYHSPDCGFCETQIEQVGADKFSWMPMVNCKEHPALCKEKGIKAFPTWLNEKTGQIHVGGISLENNDDSGLLTVLNIAPVRKEAKVNIKIGDNQQQVFA